MFNTTIEANTIAQTLDYPLALVEESKINLNEDGIAIRAVDAANVAMADLTLSQEAFESYEVGGETPPASQTESGAADGGKIGVNITRLDDVLGMADAGDQATLELNEETRKLDISIGALDYTLSLIDPDSVRQEPDLPDLDLPAEVTMSGAQLSKCVKAADMVSDHLRMGMREAGVFFAVAEGDTDEVRQEFVEDDVVDLEEGEADSRLSLDYLKDIAKTLKKRDEVTIRLGEEMPVVLSSEFANGHGEVQFMVAPRISSD